MFCRLTLLMDKGRRLSVLESGILRLVDFAVARKLLFVRYLGGWLSRSNSVGRMPASRVATLSFSAPSRVCKLIIDARLAAEVEDILGLISGFHAAREGAAR